MFLKLARSFLAYLKKPRRACSCFLARCLTCSRIAGAAAGVLIHEKFQESLQIDPRGLPCSGAGAEVDTGVDLRIPHRHGRKTRQQAADSPGPGVHGVLF